MNVQTVKFNDISFVNVTNPSDLEIKYLKNNFGFSSLNLDDYIHRTQVPMIEIFKEYSLIVLDFPFFNVNGQNQQTRTEAKESEKIEKSSIASLLNIPQTTLSSIPLLQFPADKKRRIITSQVDFFIGKDYLVVLQDGMLPPVNNIFSLCQKTLHNREEFIGKGPVFLAYRIIDALVDNCFPVMSELAVKIEKIDRELEEKKSQSTLEDISITRRNIVFFQTMIKPIIPLFRDLEEGKHKELNGAMNAYWSNVLDHLQKIWNRLEDSKELIEGISESNESLIASKTNEIVMILTIFSAVILPLNLIASVYGMNIEGLPFAHEPIALELILLFMTAIGIAMLIAFKVRRWF